MASCTPVGFDSIKTDEANLHQTKATEKPTAGLLGMESVAVWSCSDEGAVWRPDPSSLPLAAGSGSVSPSGSDRNPSAPSAPSASSSPMSLRCALVPEAFSPPAFIPCKRRRKETRRVNRSVTGQGACGPTRSALHPVALGVVPRGVFLPSRGECGQTATSTVERGRERRRSRSGALNSRRGGLPPRAAAMRRALPGAGQSVAVLLAQRQRGLHGGRIQGLRAHICLLNKR
ncbi:hypothetical protein EYF80_038702 [Liparis tanakae]|uniref:Uncharacterized protein n=1 Tax=Liparis tanakae TaxID=230148 RepID=A0A4Z2GDB8_9TELE|nr:hypothetical protein EYF80_038702 [Liparis tanakae]